MTYLYMKDKPLYRFGFGLSYTEITQEIVSIDEAGKVTVRVKNTGNHIADAVVQVYKNSDGSVKLYDDELPQGFVLSGFERVKNLHPGEECTVEVC